MDEYEHSGNVSELDWQSFFHECEECDLRPPLLAGLDSTMSDSSMSDLDNAGPTMLDRGVHMGPKPATLQAVRPTDCPRDCVGSPVEHFLNKYGVGCLENILSGSEDEDVHLESINRFFERLKSVPEVEQLIEDSRATVGIRSKAAQCGDGLQAKESPLTTSNTALQSLSGSSDTAAGNESKESDKTNAFTTETNLELPYSDVSEGKKSKSTNPKVELVIREDWMLVSANEVETLKREVQSCELLKVVLEMSADSLKTQTSGKRINVELAVCKSVNDERHRDVLLDQPLIKKSSDQCLSPNRHSSTFPEVTSYSKVTEPGQQGNRSLDSSPSTNKKKRRRKKRVSIEPVDAGQVNQRQLLASHSDSEEDSCTWGKKMDASAQLSRDYTAPCLDDAEGRLKTSLAQQIQRSHCPPSYSETLGGRLKRNKPYALTEGHEKVSLNLSTLPLQDRQSLILTKMKELRIGTEHLGSEAKCTLAKSTWLDNSEHNYQLSSPVIDQAFDCSLCTNNKGDIVVGTVEPIKALHSQLSTECKHCPDFPVSMSPCDSIESYPVTNKGKSGSENILKYQNMSGPLQMQETNEETSSEVLTEADQTECKAALDKDTSLITEASSGVSISGIMPLHAHENKGIKVPQEYGLLQTVVKSMPSPDVFTNGTLEPTKTQLGKINSFNEPWCSESDDVISQTTYHQTITKTPAREMSISTVSCNSVIPKSLMNSNQSDEMNESHINNIIEKDLNAITPESISITQSNISLNKVSNSTNLQMDVRQTIGVQIFQESMTALSDKSNTSDLPVDLFDSSGTPDFQISFNSQEKKHYIDTSTSERETSERASQDTTQDMTELHVDIDVKTEDTVTTNKSGKCVGIEKAPNEIHPVYAISAFWNEMEKLTINNILRLRMGSDTQQSSITQLSPQSNAVDISKEISIDPGNFSLMDNSKLDCSSGNRSPVSEFAEEFSENPSAYNPLTDYIKNEESSNSTGVLWESKPDQSSGGKYTENVALLSSFSKIPQPHISCSETQPHLRRISKNVSVQNLRALEAEPRCQVVKSDVSSAVILEEEEPGIDTSSYGHLGRPDIGLDYLPPASFPEEVSTKSYPISFSEVFQYFFGGKKSESRQSVTDNMATYYVNCNSVPEYEHFFSEFDAGRSSYPTEALVHSKDEQVPIISCSRLAKNNLQFPEAYDYFFSSESSADSDEENTCSPIRVITRYNRKPNETQGSIVDQDIYDNFLNDDNQGENLFWSNCFSLRKVCLAGFTSQRQTPSDSFSQIPVDQGMRSFRRIPSIKVLGFEDEHFSDQLLYNQDSKIFRQLAEQKRRYPDMQMAVPNTRLEASSLPLRQSDMCLVCIAFASWVLKSTNPDAAETWKAILLANISALSAIRYLRKKRDAT